MQDAREKAGVLADCLLALVDRSDETEIDREAAAFVVAETILLWKRSVTKK